MFNQNENPLQKLTYNSMGFVQSDEEREFDRLVYIRLKARTLKNETVIKETQEEFNKATENYILSVKRKHGLIK